MEVKGIKKTGKTKRVTEVEKAKREQAGDDIAITQSDIRVIQPKANREHKSSMFTDLYELDENARERDLELYNALHEKKLPPDTKISKIRVDKTLYMNFENDSSFEVENKFLIFSEQQSTINMNMPLRDLLYCGRAYEKLVPIKDRYKKEMVKIPKPEFYTFYNGTEWKGKERILTLSEAFEAQDGEETLELKVKVININPEAKHELLEKCPTLKEYGYFVNAVRKYQKSEEEMSLERAIELAIEECINQGILADYLYKKGSEVKNMLIAEYDYDLDIEVQREEAFELGEKRGEKLGETRAKQNAVLELLEEYGEIPEELQNLIHAQTDAEMLKKWLKLAAKVDSIEGFQQKMKDEL